MIPFEQIDQRLRDLGLDRAWLAERSGRSTGAIRSALAPGASTKHRSELLQRALTETIEREEAARGTPVSLPERVSLEASKEEFAAWCRAYKNSPHETFEEWMHAVLNNAADAWFNARQLERRCYAAAGREPNSPLSPPPASVIHMDELPAP